MKIWVTGSQGLLGVELIKAINRNFKDVQIIAPTRKQLDLSDRHATQCFVEENKPTHVYHLAATVMGVGGHSIFPEKCKVENQIIDSNVFNALALSPPKWIYYSSSVAAYGFPYKRLPLSESDWLIGTPHQSESGYSLVKRDAKKTLDWMRNNFGVKYTYGLTTNLFGESDRFQNGHGHVIVSLLNKAIEAKNEGFKLLPWGSSSVTRDFIYSVDAARYLTALFGIDAGVVNIASGREVSLGLIVETIDKKIDLVMGYEFTGEQPGISNRYCDMSKLSTIIDLEEENLLPVENYVEIFLDRYFLNA